MKLTTIDRWARRLILDIVLAVGLLTYLGGSLLFLGQVVFWLQYGTWVPVPAVALLVDEPLAVGQRARDSSSGAASSPNSIEQRNSLGVFRSYIPILSGRGLQSWLTDPKTSWIGLHRVATWRLGFVSLALLTMVAGSLLTMGTFAPLPGFGGG